jgi:hypothetical protein
METFWSFNRWLGEQPFKHRVVCAIVLTDGPPGFIWLWWMLERLIALIPAAE